MKVPFTQSYWLRRMLASDPGHKRLQQAGKATISVISSVFTTMFLLLLLGHEPLLPSIISGVCGLFGIMAVMDETKQEKKVTTWLLPLSGISGVTLGSLLSWSAVFVSILMILIIFSSFYFSKFGSRFFSLGMIGFITVYFSSFLKLPPPQFPWFYGAICIGVGFAFLYNFVIFRDSAQQLRRSVQSFHRQANLTFQLLIELIEDPDMNQVRSKKLTYNVKILRDYANHVSTDLNAQDIREVWPGIRQEQFRLYVFDTAMFIMTFSDSLKKLKESGALQTEDLRNVLTSLIRTLQQMEVLKVEKEEKHLGEAERVIATLQKMIDQRFGEYETRPDGWLYLLRRIEAIASHVTEGARVIKHSSEPIILESPADDEGNQQEDQQTEGMEPTTKKAIQSVIAGSIAVIVGHMISPFQPYWVLLTTFIVQLGTGTVGRTYLKGLERTVGTVIGAVIGFVLARFVSGQSELEVVLIFGVIFLAFYMLPVSYTVMSIFITMLIAFMYDLMLGGISYSLLLARVMDTFAGAGIALVVAAFIFPTKMMDKIDDHLIEYLEDLDAYVIEYIHKFKHSESMKGMADLAFQMDEKIQGLEEEAKPALQRPGGRKYSGIPRLLTTFTAINYYAKQLVASTYQKEFHYSDEIEEAIERAEKMFQHNIRALMDMIHHKSLTSQLYNIQEEREIIERLAPSHKEKQGDIVHHLFYVWKINLALLALGERMGLEVISLEKKRDLP
ncbi:FUSC family protein [Halobacillus karajensis]|uniref:Inner membrane protein YccS n=1 Tax=Halobacillus karajensis TaxID=195088 RepID=A0A024P2W7_9BACI|nr:FUSC family protein [Halobacillus karajensis]CDQ19811.1 Inner membrane protein YccS [Halobacillus karajensis]CDQ22271.1 Inner membrane protein YccS [Halobacillus karajensis]CDQ28112.1 Inner membrane protein YccS [Halobacillus karajensis]